MGARMDGRERRREIADAAARLAARQGLQRVTFREVAREAGVSVALVQHHFATKQELVIGLLNQTATETAERFAAEIAALGPDASPLEHLRVIALSFIPADPVSRAAMVTYHAVGAAGLTDETLRGTGPHRNAALLNTLISDTIRQAQAVGQADAGIDPDLEAHLLASSLVGLALGVLLEQDTPDNAVQAIDYRITRMATPGRTDRR